MKNTIKYLSIIALAAVIGFSMTVAGCGDDSTDNNENGNDNGNSGGEARSSMLHIEGNKILNEEGEEVRLFGVNICSLEWSSKGENVLASTREVFKNWNCILVRLPLSQDRWFGKISDFSTTNPPDGGAQYRKIVDDVINIALSFGKYIILDLHWSDAGEWGKNLDGYYMPDDNSLVFWVDVAKKYSNNNAVLFGLYNEPQDITWEVWRNGGTVNETKNKGKPDEKNFVYHTPGHQKIVDEIRALGANNIIVAGGIDFGYDLRGIASSYALEDTQEGNGIMYDSHIYPWKGLDINVHNTNVLCIADKYPILIGEIGIEPNGEWGSANNPSWLSNMLDWMDNNKLNWAAWSFHITASPNMISDWQYTPTIHHGAVIKQRLLSYPDTNAHL